MKWRVLAGMVCLAAAACGGAPSKTTEVELARAPSAVAAVAVAAEAPHLHTTGPSVSEIVRALGTARIFAVIEVAALRDHPIASRMLEVMPFVKSLDQAGIDPRREIDRILLSERSLSGSEGMAVYQHHIDPARIARFFELAAAESDPSGSATTVEGRPCAILYRHHMRGIVCAASTELLTVSFDPRPEIVKALGSSSGILPTQQGEALHITFLRTSPTQELGPLVLHDTLGTVELGMRADPDGGLSIRGVAPSENASADAAALDAELRQNLTGVARALAPPFKVEAAANEVVLTSHLSKDDLDFFMTLVSLTVPL